MKKNKKKETSPFPYPWHDYIPSFKKLFILLLFLILFLITLILAFHNYKSTTSTNLDTNISNLIKQQGPLLQQPEPQSRLLIDEEKTLLQKQLDKLTAIDILRGVIEGDIPLENLRTFLQKKEDPWAKHLLTILSPVKESSTYPQLESLLVLSSSHTQTFWKYVKNKLQSFIQIRKVENKQKVGQIKDIHKALQAHDIRKALKLYETLPPQEKAQLASWHRFAKDRFLLEKSYKDLLKLLIKI